MPVFLSPKGAGNILRTLHDPAALVIETQDGGHHISAGGCLQRGGDLLLVADAPGRGPSPGAEASGKNQPAWFCLAAVDGGGHALRRRDPGLLGVPGGETGPMFPGIGKILPNKNC